ncbi:hypothetical protein POVCU2_0016360 [Plasmodium ovale curtisi]|uniref:Uncharacterized protein n=1 Tax=Plasmodium ovale curtisi TaxID=864141 RepID=A0A1A8VQF0_PLAOA|nr:hypothetical protein POVCU2_0016360 [Plasmodium ovale curtisi]SBS87500.1 hypothetical protein POVCU1_014670 [Plasmodium ovale curtisi]
MPFSGKKEECVRKGWKLDLRGHNNFNTGENCQRLNGGSPNAAEDVLDLLPWDNRREMGKDMTMHKRGKKKNIMNVRYTDENVAAQQGQDEFYNTRGYGYLHDVAEIDTSTIVFSILKFSLFIPSPHLRCPSLYTSKICAGCASSGMIVVGRERSGNSGATGVDFDESFCTIEVERLRLKCFSLCVHVYLLLLPPSPS